MKLYLDTPVEGVTESLIFNGDGSWGRELSEDVEPILEANKRGQLEGDGYSKSRDMRHIARIPITVYYQWLAEYGCDPFDKGNEALLDRLLNDPANRHLRISTGSV